MLPPAKVETVHTSGANVGEGEGVGSTGEGVGERVGEGVEEGVGVKDKGEDVGEDVSVSEGVELDEAVRDVVLLGVMVLLLVEDSVALLDGVGETVLEGLTV